MQLLILSKSSGVAAVGGLQRRLGEEKYHQILKTHSKIYAEKLNFIIIRAEDEFKFSLSDEHYYSLLIHILISIERLLHGKYISGGDELLYSQCGETEMEIAEYISSKVEKEFNTSVPLDERVYICMHLMGSSIYEDIAEEGMRGALANSLRASSFCGQRAHQVRRPVPRGGFRARRAAGDRPYVPPQDVRLPNQERFRVQRQRKAPQGRGTRTCTRPCGPRGSSTSYITKFR